VIPYRFFHANYWIIGINLLVFMGGMLFQGLFSYLALSWPGIASGHFYWQFLSWVVTEPFSGATVFNLVFNMVALVFFGSKVEHEMGSIHYLLFCAGIGLVSGLISLGFFQLMGLPEYPIYGSTTLVLAVLMAYAALYPETVIYLMGIFPLRAPVLLLILVGIEVLLMVTSYGPAYLTHLTGLFLAWAYVLVRYRANPFRHLFR
jgi:membrane associated rhomboid family serine protease